MSTPTHRALRAVPTGQPAGGPALAAAERMGAPALTRALLDNALDCIVVTDQEGTIVEWNLAAARTFGRDRADVLGLQVAELIVPARLRDAFGNGMARRLATGATDVLDRRFETFAQRADGSEFPVELTIARIDGAPLLFACHLRDITDRREREQASQGLQEAERRHRTLLERLPVITYRAELGAEGKWLYLSPQVEEILGYSSREWQADPLFWEERIHPDDREAVLAEERRCAAARSPLDIEYRMIASDGRVVWLRDCASVGAKVNGSTTVVEGMLADVTERRLAQQRLKHLADHDDLTGLLNRRGFEHEIDRRLADGTLGEGAVVIVDLDHLKRINDSLGHAAGDALIKQVAAVLGRCTRAGDLLARLSGDEFGLLIGGIGASAAVLRADELLDAVRSREGSAAITASVGVAVLSEVETLTAADLLIAADTALYQAKAAGRDRVRVFGGDSRRRLEFVDLVRAAIENERLLVYAQPLIDTRTEEVWAEELLVRMTGDDGEPIAAGQFIPIAEAFGLIRHIDRWMVTQALDLAAGGRRVSVNLSAASITDREVTRLIADRLQRDAIDPSLLIFEVTETVTTPAIEALVDFSTRMQRLGCSLALDDVGTGFGSLTYLRHVPFDFLKIDSEFVRGVGTSPVDTRIVRSLVTIAEGFGMKTVGEGVEDEAALTQLCALGIDYVQGYHLGRPAPIDHASATAG